MPGPATLAKVLIVGGAGWGNVGDDLIAHRIVNRVLEGGNEATVAGGPNMANFPAGVRKVSMSGSRLDRLRLVWEIARSTQVVIGGGGLFDDRVPNFYRPFARVAQLSSALRKPYVVKSVGVGPIRRQGTADAYRRVFDRATSASVRDVASRQRVLDAGARTAPDIEDDPALWPIRISRERSHQFDLVVNLRNWELGERSEERPTKSTDDIVSAVATAINSRYGPHGRVCLVSMSTLDGDNDATALDKLAARIACHTTRVYSGRVDDVEDAIAGARAVLSMRLHLALLAKVYDVPVAAVAYDVKVSQQGERHGFPAAALTSEFDANAVVRLLSEVAPSLN